MASTPEVGTPPYGAGMACSLRTLGYINQRLGDFPLGLAQLLKAQELCELEKLGDALADVFDGLAGIYFQIGDYAEALKYMYKQLATAEEIRDQRRAANAYNNLANLYVASGDYERAIATFR
jgi:tetratricopeptide (TPR) repeat protein